MDPLAIKRFLKDLASASRWDSGKSQFVGQATLSTSHTIYTLTNGVCTALTRKGVTQRQGDLVGMRLIGWLVIEDERPSVSPTWRWGGRAVMWKRGFARGSIALTSPTVGFRVNPWQIESGIVPRPAFRGMGTPPPLPRPAVRETKGYTGEDSVTRLHAGSNR